MEIDISSINRKWIRNYRRLIRIHGLFETAVGGLLGYLLASDAYLSYKLTGEMDDKYFYGGGIIFCTYLVIEGVVDMLTAERKHHLTNSLLYRIRLGKLSENIPTVSSLESTLIEYEKNKNNTNYV